jgi:hypothetical protein
MGPLFSKKFFWEILGYKKLRPLFPEKFFWEILGYEI